MEKFWDIIWNVIDVIADTAYVIFEVCITLLIIGGDAGNRFDIRNINWDRFMGN